MGKNILTAKQLDFLELAQAQTSIAKRFYLTGGTEEGIYFGNLEVSSIYDIAVNKIHTITMRFRTRDYIDLYFIFKHADYPALAIGSQKPGCRFP